MTLLVTSGSGMPLIRGSGILARAAPTAHGAAGPDVKPGVPPISTSNALNTPRPSSGPFNPNCYSVNATICISIAFVGEPNIVPPNGTRAASVLPNASQSLPLVLKSRYVLNWIGANHTGTRSPIALNLTARLWNGDPYYSLADGSVWHANPNTPYWGGPTLHTEDPSYPYWYDLNITARAGSTPNFFPGMSVVWWVYIVKNQSNVFTGFEGPYLQFTYAGAWPYSPYPGSAQYAGPSAALRDVQLRLIPRQPNWNDSVKFLLNTTTADVLPDASIRTAWIDFTVRSQLGALLGAGTVPFNVSIVSPTFGAAGTATVFPARWAQVANATVRYTVTVSDMALDTVTTPAQSYVVNGNGSFLSNSFDNNIALTTVPKNVSTSLLATAVVPPGQNVTVTVASKSTTTAIRAAEIVYAFDYALLGENVTTTVAMTRINSTTFVGVLPGLPLGSYVTFVVQAWDYGQNLLSSTPIGYVVPTFDEYVPYIPTNATFFYVFVYDNGSGVWVTGARVQVTGPTGFVNSFGSTEFGVAYPNRSQGKDLPLLLPANTTYQVAVNDSAFVPTVGVRPTNAITVSVLGLNAMTARQTLLQGPNYEVVQEGNEIVYWLNTTPPNPVSSPPTLSNGVPIGAILGLVAGLAVSIPVVLWWRQIKARRQAEERRITL